MSKPSREPIIDLVQGGHRRSCVYVLAVAQSRAKLRGSGRSSTKISLVWLLGYHGCPHVAENSYSASALDCLHLCCNRSSPLRRWSSASYQRSPIWSAWVSASVSTVSSASSSPKVPWASARSASQYGRSTLCSCGTMGSEALVQLLDAFLRLSLVRPCPAVQDRTITPPSLEDPRSCSDGYMAASARILGRNRHLAVVTDGTRQQSSRQNSG